MSSPVADITKQCPSGFTLGKKLALTLGFLLYVISPIDVVPDPLLPFGIIDDGVALVLLVRVWLSPTLPGKRYYTPPAPPRGATLPAHAGVAR